MNIEHKNIAATIKAAGEDGTFEATIATFGEIDKDGDIVERGAFGSATVSVLPSHDSMSVPLGKASVEERGDLAIAVGRFNLEIEAARDWSAALKFDLDNAPSVQEWSWGFTPTEFSFEQRDGDQIRILSKVDLREVSPVLRGASVGTRTISAKGEESRPTLLDQVKTTTGDVEALIVQLQEISEGRKERGRHLGEEVQLATIEMAKHWLALNEQLTTLIKSDMLPDDAVAQAAARFLYSEAAPHIR